MIQIVSMVNYLKTCLQPYLVRSCCSDTVEVAEIVDIMASGRTTLTKPDITGCLQLFAEELVRLVADGYSVDARGAGENARAGDTIRITGRRLKFDPTNTACGVFLESDSASWRCAVYADISPSKLIATLPTNVPAGTYDLVVYHHAERQGPQERIL